MEVDRALMSLQLLTQSCCEVLPGIVANIGVNPAGVVAIEGEFKSRSAVCGEREGSSCYILALGKSAG